MLRTLHKENKIKTSDWKILDMARLKGLMLSLPFGFVLFLCSTFIIVPGVIGWSKEGHEMTCLIAQVKFKP